MPINQYVMPWKVFSNIMGVREQPPYATIIHDLKNFAKE